MKAINPEKLGLSKEKLMAMENFLKRNTSKMENLRVSKPWLLGKEK